MIKKSLLIGLLVALVIPVYINAAAEPIGVKPTLTIVCDAELPSNLQDVNLPFDDLANLVTRLLPNFNVRTVTLNQMLPKNWKEVSYVLIAVSTNIQFSTIYGLLFSLQDLEVYIRQVRPYDFKNKTYVLLRGEGKSEAAQHVIKSFSKSFPGS